MSTLINIVVDVTLSASWWIIRKATYGIYSGTRYLIWGHVETKESKRENKLIEELESLKNIQETILQEITKPDIDENSEIIETNDIDKSCNFEIIKKENIDGFELIKKENVDSFEIIKNENGYRK
jgi:hypothetical protein